MKVAVPREKHSPRFGQRASSHTVLSRSPRKSTRSSRAPGASGLPLRAQGGRRFTPPGELTAEDAEGAETDNLGWLTLSPFSALSAVNSVFYDEWLELLLVPQPALDALGFGPGRERAHAHVEEPVGRRR
jgi:hypothetical protein